MATKANPHKRSDGSIAWRVRFRLSKDTNPVNETFDDQDEALRFAALVDKVGGVAARKARNAADVGLGASLDTGFERYVKKIGTRVQDDTIDKYKRNWARYIQPAFGPWPMDAIEREAVEEWIGELRQTETLKSKKDRLDNPDLDPDYLAPKTIRNIHGLLSSVLKNEVVRGRLGINVAYGIDLPAKKKKREAVFLSENDYAVLISKVIEEWQPLIALLAGTGLRWSEATALRPVDLDLSGPSPVVRVTRAWKRRGPGKPWHIGPPKTEQSTRTVALSKSVCRLLVGAVEGVASDALIFTGPRGGRLTGEWFHERVWSPAVNAAKLVPAPVIHDLRHSHASWLIMRGVPLTVIQRRLGHSSIKVTSDIYGSLSPDAWTMAAAATEAAMSGGHPVIEDADGALELEAA